MKRVAIDRLAIIHYALGAGWLTLAVKEGVVHGGPTLVAILEGLLAVHCLAIADMTTRRQRKGDQA